MPADAATHPHVEDMELSTDAAVLRIFDSEATVFLHSEESLPHVGGVLPYPFSTSPGVLREALHTLRHHVLETGRLHVPWGDLGLVPVKRRTYGDRRVRTIPLLWALEGDSLDVPGTAVMLHRFTNTPFGVVLESPQSSTVMTPPCCPALWHLCVVADNPEKTLIPVRSVRWAETAVMPDMAVQVQQMRDRKANLVEAALSRTHVPDLLNRGVA